MKIDLQIERVISELKRGEKVVIIDSLSQRGVLLSAAEMVQDLTLNDHLNTAKSYPNIILSSRRCNALGIKTNKNCSLLVDLNWRKEKILSITLDKKINTSSIFDGLIEENNIIVNCCLELLVKSKLLPTGIMTLIANVNFNEIVEWTNTNNLIYMSVQDLKFSNQQKDKNLEIIAKAHLPIKQTDDCDIVVFRSNNDFNEYFCLLIGKARKTINENLNFTPTLRIHSQCITGDILNSLKCDCGDQLRDSIDLMVKNNEGILIYLSQEGRNIGLTNKLRAYKLQEDGLDTVDANLTLGFSEDERNYDVAKQILQKLNVNKVKLITNNPLKIKDLQNSNIDVSSRISLSVNENPYNQGYLNTKKTKSGHYI